MMTSLSRWALLLALVFLLPIVLILAQPYDDSALRALVTPPADCASPCFMGIRPGRTTTRDALTILESHPWVAEVVGIQAGIYRNALITQDFTAPVVHWTWSDQRPAWLTQGRDGELWLENGRVRSIGVYTSILLGNVRLSLGTPDSISLSAYANATGNYWSYTGWYDHQGVWIAANGLCPLRRLYTGRALFRFQVAPPDFPEADMPGAVC